MRHEREAFILADKDAVGMFYMRSISDGIPQWHPDPYLAQRFDSAQNCTNTINANLNGRAWPKGAKVCRFSCVIQSVDEP